jgi:hypothetical protein
VHGGNIDVDRAAFANLVSEVVGGNVTIVDGVGTGIQFSYRVERLTAPKGNILVLRNSGGVTVGFNDVRKGSIRVEDNVSSTVFAVRNNVVGEHILALRNLGPRLQGRSLERRWRKHPVLRQRAALLRRAQFGAATRGAVC